MVRSFLAYTYICIWAWFGGMISLSRATTQMWLYIPMQTCGEEGPEVETGDTRGRALRHEQRLKVDRRTDRPTNIYSPSLPWNTTPAEKKQRLPSAAGCWAMNDQKIDGISKGERGRWTTGGKPEGRGGLGW
ncbi:hypothetical protein BDDG_13631 [Blastomyces dermatitidis ATCC 18188]|uniref:Uncharacterized protein n=1 Tax=Ajellomyces dermatitidis (strain ATCC 18188 / CBS 674.68) TaxID=653446 RepID=A0A0J9ETY4_AJEDA|nr:hypothetical protein BDDG_13631 [Blastomyces dermatitidis ATCC 18188]